MMNIKTISSIFVFFTIITGFVAISPESFADYLHPVHPAFADHHEVTITPVSGSGSGPGCELTDKGCYSPNTSDSDSALSMIDKVDSIGVIATFTASLNNGCSLSKSAMYGENE